MTLHRSNTLVKGEDGMSGEEVWKKVKFLEVQDGDGNSSFKF